MTFIIAIMCWFHPAPGYPPSSIVMQQQPPRANVIRTNGQLRRPPGG